MIPSDSLQEAVLSPKAYRTIVDLVYQHSRIRLGAESVNSTS